MPSVRTAYELVAKAGVPRILRRARRGACVFCFHNVVAPADAGLGDTSLHMPVDRFEALVDWISSVYTVVGIEELGRRIRDGRSTSGLAALTFDDAYEGFVRYGLPVLDRRDTPATVFVVPGAADEPGPFWWDRLGARGVLTTDVRDRCLVEHHGIGAEVVSGVPEAVDGPAAAPLPETFLPASWSRILAAAAGRDHLLIGSHTLTHANLTVVPSAALERELVRSRSMLEERTGAMPEVVSYPYGLHDARVQEAARNAGYTMGLTLDTGLAGSRADLLAVPRLNVPAGIGRHALECWAVGLRPRG